MSRLHHVAAAGAPAGVRLSCVAIATAVALTILGGVAAQPASATHPLGFDPAYGYSASYADNVAFGDFNGDGIVDYAAANWSSFYSRFQFERRLGDGTGRFGSASLYNLAAANPYCVVVADFNEDGLDDVAVLCNIRVEVYLSTGTGFTMSISAVTPSSPGDMDVGDFNGDGHVDVVVSWPNANNVGVLLGDGAGHLGTPILKSLATGGFPSPGPKYLTVADFDADGHLDLATNTYASTAKVIVVRGLGDGTFGSPSFLDAGPGPEHLRAADVDEDGDQDLVVPCDFNTNAVWIRRNDGLGGFAAATQVVPAAAARPVDVDVADMNGDGHVDLVAADHAIWGWFKIFVMPGDGSGAFATSMTLSTSMGIKDVTTVDTNGDGRRDVAVALQDAISLFLADTLPPVSTPATDASWHAAPYSFGVAAVDQNGAFGTGVATNQYAFSPAGPWFDSSIATVATWKRGGGSGVRTVYYRAADAVGNVEAAKSVTVKVDGRAPCTVDDAPTTTVAGPVTVHFSASDAHAGVASTWYALDGGDPVQGASVAVSGAGVHWIAYYSIDNVGNVETPRWCAVSVGGGGRALGRPVARARR